MRSTPALSMRDAFVIAILIGLMLAVARAVPADETHPQFQVQADAEIVPPTMESPSSSSTEAGDHRVWHKLIHDTWNALTAPANNARASMRSGRRGRYFRRARAHP
ncbi:hypothetical protein ACEPAG_1887 [Sanghuangporus baumii]